MGGNKTPVCKLYICNFQKCMWEHPGLQRCNNRRLIRSCDAHIVWLVSLWCTHNHSWIVNHNLWCILSKLGWMRGTHTKMQGILHPDWRRLDSICVSIVFSGTWSLLMVISLAATLKTKNNQTFIYYRLEITLKLTANFNLRTYFHNKLVVLYFIWD